MTLLGPASELHTYLLLGPAVAFGLVEVFSDRSDTLSRALSSYRIPLLASGDSSRRFHPPLRELLHPFTSTSRRGDFSGCTH